jgi:hypothetical protein
MSNKNIDLEVKRASKQASAKEAMNRSGIQYRFRSATIIFSVLTVIFFLILEAFTVLRATHLNEYNTISIDILYYSVNILLPIVYTIFMITTSKLFSESEKKFAESEFAKDLGLDIHFFRENRSDFMGSRFLIFAEKMRELNLNLSSSEIDEIKKQIDEEAELKKIIFFERPFVAFCLGILGALIVALFSHNPDFILSAILTILFIILPIYFSLDMLLFGINKSKTRNVKLFLLWYKRFAKKYLDNKDDKSNNENKTESGTKSQDNSKPTDDNLLNRA